MGRELTPWAATGRGPRPRSTVPGSQLLPPSAGPQLSEGASFSPESGAEEVAVLSCLRIQAHWASSPSLSSLVNREVSGPVFLIHKGRALKKLQRASASPSATVWAFVMTALGPDWNVSQRRGERAQESGTGPSPVLLGQIQRFQPALSPHTS